MTATRPCAAMLEHLTGPSRGTCSWISSGSAQAWLDAGNRLVLTDPGARPDGATAAASFACTPSGFEIEAATGTDLWVNRRPVRAVTLLHGDMIEFGEHGPLSRVRLYDDAHRPAPSVGEIFGDSLSYIRASRRPLGRRVPQAAADTLRRLIWDTTLVFRGGVVLVLVLLTLAVGWQYWSAQRLRAELTSGAAQIDAIAAALADARREAIRAGDLKALSDDLRARLDVNAERLQNLEARSGDGARIIAAAAPSVAFLQGAYGLRDRTDGRMLRHVLGPNGVPLMAPNGQPLLALEGTGPVAEVQFNGTGFMLREARVLITNRHVARPWEKSPGLRREPETLEPAMIRLVAYFPGQTAPVDLTEAAVDDAADLAALYPAVDPGVDGLVPADTAPLPGQEVIVIGYPTGLMSLLARSGPEFIDGLRASGETGFWQVAQRLADAGLIAPLSSGGIVGQVGEQAVVYDAETTHGGSGGPVLNRRGQVVAVNAAIMPEFGGANLGVPAARIGPLLRRLAPDG
jgi:S1-C subfamily serine protease